MSAQTIAPGIHFERYTVTKYPEYKPMTDVTGSISNQFRVLVNDSAKAITAYMAIWAFTKADGSPGRVEMGISMYGQNTLIGAPVPLVKAHGHDLLIPKSAWAMIYQGTTKVNGPTIDCLVLEDGSVYGPDSLHFVENIIARHDAGKALAAQVKAGKAQGKSSSDVYKALATSSSSRPRTSSGKEWLGQLAGRALVRGMQAPGPAAMTPAMAEAAYLQSLDHTPDLPTFKRVSK